LVKLKTSTEIDGTKKTGFPSNRPMWLYDKKGLSSNQMIAMLLLMRLLRESLRPWTYQLLRKLSIKPDHSYRHHRSRLLSYPDLANYSQ